MQKKLTLRMDSSVIEKAKRLAREQQQSVSALFSEFIIGQPERIENLRLSPVTESMVGQLRQSGREIDERDYQKHLEEKHA